MQSRRTVLFLAMSMIWFLFAPSLSPIILILMITLHYFVYQFGVLDKQVRIETSRECLDIYENNSLLWRTPVSAITRVELRKDERWVPRLFRSALLIENAQGDSYLLSLDDVEFGELDGQHLLADLSELVVTKAK